MTFQIVKDLPPLKPLAIEEAIYAFISEIDVKGDPVGFYNQTINSIAASTYLRQGGDFWLAHEDGQVIAYALGHVTRDIDNRLTYWLSQAWIRPSHRGLSFAKECWEKMRQQAKHYMCAHIVVVSGRSNNEAYCRFLGPNYAPYATLLKEDL